MGHRQYQIDFYAILAFSFLSGYLSGGSYKDPRLWLKKRYFRIMIPYWIVIILVYLANMVNKYKQVTWLKGFAALIGGNMFVEDPLYVISWYITLVLIFYLYAFLQSFCSYPLKIIFTVVCLLIFSVWLDKTYYFIAFVAGLCLSERRNKRSTSPHFLYWKVSSILFFIQKYCYSFFLIHGGVLLFFFRVINVRPFSILVLSFVATSFFSVLLYSIVQPLQIWATNQGPIAPKTTRVIGSE